MKILNKIEEYILLITFPLMTIITVAGTTVRYLELGSLTWSEEAARYLMIIAAFAGISLGFRENSHLGLSFFVGKIPVQARKVLEIARNLLVLLFCVMLTFFAFQIVQQQMQVTQYSPAMRIPMWIVYIPVFLGGIMMTVRVLQSIFWPAEADSSQEVML